MKRYLALTLVCLLLFPSFAFARGLTPFPVVYRGTVTGLRISAVDGTAFIDNAGATIPTYADGNHLIEVYDSSGRMLRGVLKAAGSAEGLTDLIGGTDPALRNGDFAVDEPAGVTWTRGPGWVITGGQLVGTNVAGGVLAYVNGVGPVNSLIKFSYTIGSFTTGAIRPYFLTATSAIHQVSSPTTGLQSGYATQVTAARLGITTANTVTVAINSCTFQQVTTPSTSGATIVSLRAGTVYNWAHKNASFTYNAASYYVIVKTMR